MKEEAQNCTWTISFEPNRLWIISMESIVTIPRSGSVSAMLGHTGLNAKQIYKFTYNNADWRHMQTYCFSQKDTLFKIICFYYTSVKLALWICKNTGEKNKRGDQHKDLYQTLMNCMKSQTLKPFKIYDRLDMMIVCSQRLVNLVERNSCNHLWVNAALISSTLDLEETWNNETQNMI